MAHLGQKLLEHVPQLRRYARALTGNGSDADDLVQECLTRLLSKRSGCAEIRNLRAYLFATLHNLYVGQMNGHRPKMLELDSGPEMDRLAASPIQVDTLLIRDLERALRLLPRAQREVILLIGLDGLKYCEAARVLGVPLGTVMSRLSRGRETLRALVDGQDAEARIG